MISVSVRYEMDFNIHLDKSLFFSIAKLLMCTDIVPFSLYCMEGHFTGTIILLKYSGYFLGAVMNVSFA